MRKGKNIPFIAQFNYKRYGYVIQRQEEIKGMVGSATYYDGIVLATTREEDSN